ncbi:MAG: hypothetical protein LBV79_10600, partial [Candidatus Adiutrix sp.]|nr:hypothetical protein [Candidatus Adiutrix sp.]
QSQAQDIQNIHQSIAQMDKVTQENAAEAGQTRSLSQGLTHQAAVLTEALEELLRILKGADEADRLRRRSGRRPGAAPVAAPPGPSPAELQMAEAPKSFIVDSTKKSKMEEVIPMDDDF